MSDVAPEPEKSSDRFLEELFGCTRFVRNGLSGCDAYDLEAFCNLKETNPLSILIQQTRCSPHGATTR